MNVQNKPKRYSLRSKKRVDEKIPDPGTQAEWEMVNQTRRAIRLSSLTSAAAVVGLFFTGMQLYELRSGGKVALKQSEAAVTHANTAKSQVSISRQQADTAQQSVAVSQEAVRGTLRLANAAELQADISRIQANAALQTLRITQDPRVDVVVANVSPYDFRSGFYANFVVSGTGYTIEGVKVYSASALLAYPDIQTIWGKLEESGAIMIVPEKPHEITVDLLPLTESDWKLFISKEMGVVHAIRIEFKDASGRFRKIERCIAYSGSFENFVRTDCAMHRGKKN